MAGGRRPRGPHSHSGDVASAPPPGGVRLLGTCKATCSPPTSTGSPSSGRSSRSTRCGFGALAPGEPLLFQLESPHNAIGGLGLFARYQLATAKLTFRVAVTGAYGQACAVTGEHSLPVLEAAHIRPFADDGPHAVSNGLLLRADVHRLFDGGYVKMTPDLRFVVSARLEEEFDNGRVYYERHGAPIHVPARREDHPGVELLRWHDDKVFERGRAA